MKRGFKRNFERYQNTCSSKSNVKEIWSQVSFIMRRVTVGLVAPVHCTHEIESLGFTGLPLYKIWLPNFFVELCHPSKILAKTLHYLTIIIIYFDTPFHSKSYRYWLILTKPICFFSTSPLLLKLNPLKLLLPTNSRNSFSSC